MGDSTDRSPRHPIDTAAVDVDVDDEWGWDHLTLFTVGLFRLYPDGGSLRIGTGETVPASYLTMRARMLFLQALYRLVPDSTTTLLTEEAYGLMDACAVAMSEWRAYAREHGIDGSLASEKAETFPAVEEDVGAVVDHILEWQQRYRLPHDWRYEPRDHWIFSAANFTMTAAKRLRDLTGDRYDGPLAVRDVIRVSVHDGRTRSLYEMGSGGYEVTLDINNLRGWTSDPEGSYIDSFPDPFGTFDPRTETVNAAEKRLMEALRPRLRQALETIVADDREGNAAMGAVEFRKVSAFEWLVRFQVLGESRGEISRALADARLKRDPEWEQYYRPDFYKSHIGREIRKVADLIGLTLRDA